MSSYAVADPQIEEVLDLETGECLRAASLTGSDYGELMQLRSRALANDRLRDCEGSTTAPLRSVEIIAALGEGRKK